MNDLGRRAPDRRDLVTGAAFLLPARLVGIGAMYLLGIVLARSLGAGGAGLYFWGYSVFVIVGVLARLGTQSAVVQSVAVSLNGPTGASPLLGALISIALIPSLAVSAAGVMLLLLANGGGRAEVAGWFLIALLPYAAIVLPAAIARGAGRTFWMALEFGGYPLLVLIGVGVVALLAQQISAVMTAFVLMTALLGMVGVFSTRHLIRVLRLSPVLATRTDLLGGFRAAAPFLLLSIGALAFTWTDVLVVGSLRSSVETGVYSAAAKTAGLIGLIVTTLELAVAPVIAGSHASKDEGVGRWAYLVSTRWAGVATCFACGSLAVVAYPALQLYGSEFVQGVPVLLVMVGGQLVNGLIGPVAMIGAMSGLQGSIGRASVALVVVNLILNVALIVWIGPMGAALATVLSIAGFKGYVAFLVYRRHGWGPWQSWDLRMLVPPAVAVSALWIGWAFTSTRLGLAGLAMSLLGAVVAFIGLYVAFASTERERAFLVQVTGRWGSSVPSSP